MKITQEQQQKGQELYNELVQKAWKSATFKEEFIKNPKVIIEDVIGGKVKSKAIKFIVEDQTDANTLYLNIPRKFDVDEFELTDEQLEMVSGGEVGGTALIVIGVVSGVATLFGTGVLLYQVMK